MGATSATGATGVCTLIILFVTLPLRSNNFIALKSFLPSSRKVYNGPFLTNSKGLLRASNPEN